MRPRTDTLPKALLEAGGKPLIVWHIEKLAAAGFAQIVVNHAHLGAQIETQLGNGTRFGVEILYSRETQALETAGGIANALPLLNAASFAAVNADVYSDYRYQQLAARVQEITQTQSLAHLILVDNPAHNPGGDFALDGRRVAADGPRLTFSGIAVYRSELFAAVARGVAAPLAPLLRELIALQRVSGEHYRGRWHDIGTPERLTALNRELAER